MNNRTLFSSLLCAVTLLSIPVHASELSPYERYEGSEAEEAKLVSSLAQKFLILQENSKHQGEKVRGTHAKGTCVDGELKINENIDPIYRVGLFAKPATYQTRVRFANGGSTIEADSVPDARAISLAVDLGDGRRQDFAMNNGPIFPIGNLTDFNFLLDVGFAKAQALQEALANGSTRVEAEQASERAAKWYLATHPTNVPGFLQVIKRGAELKNQDVKSYRNLRYWSGSAFKFGENRAAKFALYPCRATLETTPNLQDPDFLQNDLKEAVNSDRAPTCFDLQVQVLDVSKMRLHGLFTSQELPAWQWVEDVTLDWDAAGVTSYTVARLSLKPYSVYDAAVCDDPANAINVVKNALPEHRGLGRINRARAVSEEASKKNR